MRRRVLLISVAAIGALAIAAIVAALVGSTRSTPRTTLTQPTWNLTTLVLDGQAQTLSPSHPATLQFDAHVGNISGTGGCNTFGGAYTLNGNQIQFVALRSTLIASADPVVTAQESHYFQALSRVQTFQVAGTALTLRGDGNRIKLTFRAG